MNLLNLFVEDRQTRAEQQLQVINSQLELEKIKLQQIEREIELQKALAEGQATQQSSKGDTNNLENLIKSAKTMKSENKDKNTDDIIIPATDEKEAYKKVARVLETAENIKKRLPSSKTSEFIPNNNVLFKISEIQELLVVPEMMQVTKVKLHDRYDVAKIGDHEGPNVTSASADQMKPWT
ncbi:hypothetical protein TNCV_3822081 [Trichonephila clavipes]|nr:hypothetical protein TNCV_3822081 [Trichonephila clavipes]